MLDDSSLCFFCENCNDPMHVICCFLLFLVCVAAVVGVGLWICFVTECSSSVSRLTDELFENRRRIVSLENEIVKLMASRFVRVAVRKEGDE